MIVGLNLISDVLISDIDLTNKNRVVLTKTELIVPPSVRSDRKNEKLNTLPLINPILTNIPLIFTVKLQTGPSQI